MRKDNPNADNSHIIKKLNKQEMSLLRGGAKDSPGDIGGHHNPPPPGKYARSLNMI